MERQASDAVLPRVDMQLSTHTRQRNRAAPSDGIFVPVRNHCCDVFADLQYVGILSDHALETPNRSASRS
jgi:hypothetical protein